MRKCKTSVSSAVMAESQRSLWGASPHVQHQTKKTLNNGWKTGLCDSKKGVRGVLCCRSQLWFLCKRLYFRRIILREDHVTQPLPQIGDFLWNACIFTDVRRFFKCKMLTKQQFWLVLLTHGTGNPVWFVFPLHSNEVDGDSGEHDH